MLKNKEFNIENLKASAITLKRHASKYELHKENDGELSALKSIGKY